MFLRLCKCAFTNQARHSMPPSHSNALTSWYVNAHDRVVHLFLWQRIWMVEMLEQIDGHLIEKLNGAKLNVYLDGVLYCSAKLQINCYNDDTRMRKL